MNKLILNIIILVLFAASCSKKEDVYPDLAKEIEGKWGVYNLAFQRQANDSVYYYNPVDSAQVGQINVIKIDPLTAKVQMLVKTRNGRILYDYSFESTLSRDINDLELILFRTNSGSGSGGYNSNTKILYVSGVGENKGEYKLTGAWLEARK